MSLLIAYALNLICWVESRDNPNIKDGDFGRAVGQYQLHKGVIDDVNKIYDRSFSYDDRKRPRIARSIAFLYLKYYVGRYEKKTGKKADVWVVCKIFNGGPNGYLQGNIKYMAKIKEALKEKGLK